MPKKKPSLYKGDYYTTEEYTALHKLLVNPKGLIASLLFVHTEKSYSKNIKVTIQSLSSITDVSYRSKYGNGLSIYNLVYNTSLENVPLSLNKSDLHRTICQWRFQINK
jgi:hypothetical protein